MEKTFRLTLTLLLVACGGGNAGGPGPQAGPEKPPQAAGPSAEAVAKEKFEHAATQYKEMEKAGKVDYAALKASFQAALSDDPRLVEAYHNLGIIAEAEGKAD